MTRKKARKRAMFTGISLVLALALAMAATWFFRDSEEEYYHAQYPRDFSEYVEQYAAEYDLAPSLVYAVIHTESHFDPEAVSSAGAVGLMQMTPDTFDWAQWREKVSEPAGEEMLTDPETNIKFGCATLHHLGKLFATEETVLAAYNAGMGNVSKWLDDPTYSDDGETLHTIPFPETEQYVKKVAAAKEMYQTLYNMI